MWKIETDDEFLSVRQWILKNTPAHVRPFAEEMLSNLPERTAHAMNMPVMQLNKWLTPKALEEFQGAIMKVVAGAIHDGAIQAASLMMSRHTHRKWNLGRKMASHSPLRHHGKSRHHSLRFR